MLPQTTSNMESKAMLYCIYTCSWRGFLNQNFFVFVFVWKVSSILWFLSCKCLASHLKVHKLLQPVHMTLTLAHSDYTATGEDCFLASPAFVEQQGRPRLEMAGLKVGDGTPPHSVPEWKRPDLVDLGGQWSQRLWGIPTSGEVTIGSAHLYSTHCHSNYRKTEDLISRMWNRVLHVLSV